MIDVSLHLKCSSSSRVRIFFSLYLFCMYKVEVVIEVSGSFCVLNKPGGGGNMQELLVVITIERIDSVQIKIPLMLQWSVLKKKYIVNWNNRCHHLRCKYIIFFGSQSLAQL